MIVIPKDKIQEWEDAYSKLPRYQTNDCTLVNYVAHCAAQWAYAQGMIDMQRLAEQSYH